MNSMPPGEKDMCRFLASHSGQTWKNCPESGTQQYPSELCDPGKLLNLSESIGFLICVMMVIRDLTSQMVKTK